MKKEIPTTKLRNFYDLLELFSTKTQLSIVKDLNRNKNYLELIDIYRKSKEHFQKYYNIDEPFFGNSKRKTPEESGDRVFKNTTDVIYHLTTHENLNVANNPKFNFKYINREISTIRTTNAVFDTGHMGTSSGIGGIDFIGWNISKQLPILGEIKCGGDQNPFYALIQLLTYCSELSTINQINRVNKYKLFNSELYDDNKYFLYIILADYNLKSPLKKEITNQALKLSKSLKKGIDEIADIVLLKMNKTELGIFTIEECV